MSSKPTWRADDFGEIPERVMSELEAAEVERGRPLIAVDADEVLVHFAEHFGEYVAERGHKFALTEYSLDTALREADGSAMPRERVMPLVWGFIEEHTRWQREIDGAAAALRRLSASAQVVVLTNAPAKMRDDRIANLFDLGMDYPVVMNEGGKGRALNWLQRRADAPVAFVDDNAGQLASAAKHAAPVGRFHLVGSSTLKPIVGKAEAAHAHPHDWEEAVDMIERALAYGF